MYVFFSNFSLISAFFVNETNVWPTIGYIYHCVIVIDGLQWQVKAACIGARISSAPPVDILPRHKPYLHKIQPKDPIELENGGYVRKLSV